MHNTNFSPPSVFRSLEWQHRIRELGMDRLEPFVQTRLKGLLQLSFWSEGQWSDLEDWRRIPWDSSPGCDWLMVRKLTEQDCVELRNARGARGQALPYGASPYLDLTEPVRGQTERMAHVRRTHRKAERELGPIRRVVARSPSELYTWIHSYSQFQATTLRMTSEQLRAIKQWVLGAPIPSWMLPVLLYAGESVLAAGLFYEYAGVVSYHSSAMNPDPKLRRYGSGKLIVQSMIDYAVARGCREFDFLQGSHEYKSHWNPRSRPLYQWVEPRSLLGRAALGAWTWKRKLTSSGARA